jgi:hypothetical protein
VNCDSYTATLRTVLMLAFVEFVPQKKARGINATQRYRSHKYAHKEAITKLDEECHRTYSTMAPSHFHRSSLLEVSLRG